MLDNFQLSSVKSEEKEVTSASASQTQFCFSVACINFRVMSEHVCDSQKRFPSVYLGEIKIDGLLSNLCIRGILYFPTLAKINDRGIESF